MLSKDAQVLERWIMAEVNAGFPESPPSEEQFMEIANELRLLKSVNAEEFDVIIKKLKSSLLITMDVGVFISDSNSEYQSWLPNRRSEIDFYYWNRYKRYLEDIKGWNTRVTANLDQVSSEIVDLLGDPLTSRHWQRRGLVLGDVQSGKTANYTAICNKAADTGYKVIVVLAGMMENLRVQTQERLDKEFAGRMSKDLLRVKGNSEVKNVFDGVGKIDSTKRIAAFTTVLSDFNSVVLKSNDLTLKTITEPALFVVKKNKSILRNLESWLCTNNADSNGKIDLPFLLIDDEADNASVNTKKEDESPTAINAAVRSILSRFYQASYVGITATPFANIFIHPETTDEMVGDDLFPKDFIYVLSPPTNYIGANSIFGDFPKYGQCLQPIKTEETEMYLPIKHKKDLQVDELPPSLYEAIAYFVLANVVRDIRGDEADHRSMLVNVSRFTDVQISIRENIVEWLNSLRSDIRNYAHLDDFRAMQISSLQILKQVWNSHGLEAKSGISWTTLRKDYLLKSSSPIEVRAVNQKTGVSGLNYYAHKDGFRVIAIGGNSLSRGLTLEGLCVSYFYRNSQMYDTLLQMGRWFGYRPNYDDIIKIWISEEAIDWYGYINNASNELKDEIGRMNQLNLTPRDFGLKVRQDPNSLIATARNKMRNAKPVSRPISVSGRLLETPRLKAKPEILLENERVFKSFIYNLDVNGTRVFAKKNVFLWSGINKYLIANLLRGFETHPWHLSFQGRALADYIESDPGLELWDVFLPSRVNGNEYELNTVNGNLKINPEQRTITESNGMLRVSGTKVRVGSGGCTRAGLSDEQIRQAEAEFKRNHPGIENVSDNAYLIENRNPLLMLHVLESKKDEKDYNPKIPNTLFAIGIGLPGKVHEVRTANYMVNVVELRSWEEMEDDEDDSDVI